MPVHCDPRTSDFYSLSHRRRVQSKLALCREGRQAVDNRVSRRDAGEQAPDVPHFLSHFIPQDDRPVRGAATYWGIPRSDTDVTNTEDMSRAEKVRRFKGGYTLPGLTLVHESVAMHSGSAQTGL